MSEIGSTPEAIARAFVVSRPIPLLIETVDRRIARALDRLKDARAQGHPCLIGYRERQLDNLLDLRLVLTDDPQAAEIRSASTLLPKR